MTELSAIASNVRELTEPGRHVEPFRVWVVTRNARGEVVKNDKVKWHASFSPSLLTVLRMATFDQAQTPVQAASGPARTVPHLNPDAIDRMQQIARSARRWCATFDLDPGARVIERLSRNARDLAETFPLGVRPAEVFRALEELRKLSVRIPSMPEFDVRGMVGAAAGTDPDTRKQMALDLERWRAWCRIFGGWDSAPIRPHARCIQCNALAGIVEDKPTGLRVHWEKRAAVCLSCNATWGDPPLPAIEILGRHIREAELAARAATTELAARTPVPGHAGNHGGRS